MLKAYLFGAGGGGARLYDCVKEQYEIIGIVDNDKRKWKTPFRDMVVEEPEKALRFADYDVVVVTSAPGKDSIVSQLREYGIAENRIITSFVSQPLESRRIFLENLAMLMKFTDRNAAVAEAGVFQGDFAKYINRYFADRKLYLFDTFEGFAPRDIVLERSNSFSSANEADYDNTSQELVLQKMMHPENCIFKVGYFPETAQGIEDKFCFVNLDLDLYQPTLEGLKWFESRMVPGGVILIHDYFTENFKGVKQAVETFMEMRNNSNLRLMPIGDGISIAVCGF